jgi:pimeloyl-ACP methyl ester carboxylesterase
MGGWTATGFALGAGARQGAGHGVHHRRVRLPQVRQADQAALAAWTRSPSRQGDRLAHGIHPAGGARMAREQPLLHFLYREIDDQNRELVTALRPRLLRRVPLSSRRRGLCVSTLFITGEEDAAIPPAGVAAMAAVPNARLERVPEAGHSVYFERAAHSTAWSRRSWRVK